MPVLSLRWRLTLWYSALLLVVLAATGVLIYIVLSRNLLEEIDRDLAARGSQVHSVLTFSSGELGPSHVTPAVIDPPGSQLAGPSVYVQVTDERGSVLVRSTNLRDEELPVDTNAIADGLAGRSSASTLTVDGRQHIRVMTLPLIHGQSVLGLVQVGQPLHQIDAALQRLSYLLVGGISLIWFFASFVGWALAGRTLRTVGEISQTADHIAETQDFAQRLSYRGPKDEVGDLASTFNRMIARIDRSFQAQRQFVADSSHELGTPLTIIRGNVDLLKRNLSDEDRQESLTAIQTATVRMDRIIGDLLMLSNLDEGQDMQPENVSLNTLVEEVYNETRVCATEHTLEIGRLDTVNIFGQPERLRELLVNLVDNALKYTPPGGRITLSLRHEQEWARLSVSDTGIGIPPENQDRVFDRFYRVDKARSRSRGGTGLGLSIVKAVAIAHGGSVRVQSKLGEGSTFIVLLPARSYGSSH
ncbi:MAG: HAMP domain-containing protein [Chloroflexota bacterium]|nr:MAG: HAMP domain-containing protein [Chloroflexota bacterium]